MWLHFLPFLAVLFAFGSAASCVDGVNNVFQLNDLSGGFLPITVQNVIVATYTSDKKPSCADFDDVGRPSVEIPGVVRVLSGQIVVKEKVDLQNYEAKFTVEKEGWFGRFSKICKDGRDGIIGIVPCSSKFCKLIGKELCALLAVPGTYDIEKIKSGDIDIPGVLGILHSVLKGNWRGSANVESANGKVLARLQIAAKNDENVINLA
ncbi:hypothetical protein L596_019505 [Steinernema carpocapsae]|uniref:Uncharacterized protein n=1 Tax=Steinernema carpocapsae TaxID=34508 RepID=A0A4U5MQR1_STECR|nr:hypothetical protein L596_019505 [Steinernema carpocapsae]